MRKEERKHSWNNCSRTLHLHGYIPFIESLASFFLLIYEELLIPPPKVALVDERRVVAIRKENKNKNKKLEGSYFILFYTALMEVWWQKQPAIMLRVDRREQIHQLVSHLIDSCSLAPAPHATKAMTWGASPMDLACCDKILTCPGCVVFTIIPAKHRLIHPSLTHSWDLISRLGSASDPLLKLAA